MRTAKRKLGKLQNIDYQLGDILELVIEESSYDLVVIHFALHDIPKALQQDRVSRLSELLKEGDLLYIKEPTKISRGMSPERINVLMRNTGSRKRNRKRLKTPTLLSTKKHQSRNDTI
jgi:ubiquinone/menaquinone biosynthesis C-methylase UbiE